jgi:pyruvate dehydrogenase (quinone)
MSSRQKMPCLPAITFDQALGFSLYMIRAVLSGRSDEVIDLARTNLFR